LRDQSTGWRDEPKPGPDHCGPPVRFYSKARIIGSDWKKENTMGELGEKIKGNTNEAIGKAKQQSGNPETRNEGRKQEAKGEGQQLKGEVEGALGNDV
jgi:uncharacterized protein YjbJ (UPF0337 family)